MKILFLTHRLPYPPNDGARVRPYNIIKYLSKGNKITLATLVESKEELECVGNLEEYVEEIIYSQRNPILSRIKCIFSLLRFNNPLSLSYFYSRKLQRLIKDKLSKERFDLIFCYSSSMAQYVAKQNGGIVKILDLCDVDSEKWLQMAQLSRLPFSLVYQLEGNRLRKYEAYITKKFNHTLVISAKEKETLEVITGDGIKIAVVPNGVNYEYFRQISNRNGAKSIIFTGVMDYYPNVDAGNYFYSQIYPQIKEEVKDVIFYMVGRNPHKSIQNIARRDESVIVTGKVDDVREYLGKASVSVAPMRIARGIQNKILEAMAMGLPVITTKNGIEGIKGIDGENVIVANSPEDIARRTIELLRNKGLRDKIGQNARKLIEKEYDWESLVNQLQTDIIEKRIREPYEKINIPEETFYRKTGKRIFDVIMGIIGMIVFTPVMVVVAFLIKMSSLREPILFKQIRVGQDGEFFTVYKFRTMKNGSEIPKIPQIIPDKERISLLGRILRKTALDELPQFFNVLKGEMSIVGPRPERPFFVNMHGCLQDRRLHIKPGLFCLTEIKYGFSDDNGNGKGIDLTKKEGQEERARLDIEYIKKCSFWIDVKLIFQMAWKILLREYYFSKLLLDTNGNGNGNGHHTEGEVEIKGYLAIKGNKDRINGNVVEIRRMV